MKRSQKSALLCGASGLVGSECLKLLVQDDFYNRIVILTRRNLGGAADHPKVRQQVIDFSELARHQDVVAADHIFCALGTTIRKAGSRARFREVDFEYPVQIGEMALANGAQHYSIVSSQGANPRSKIFYYRVKGEVEEAICALGFPSIAILRPSLLVGDRTEFRLGERIGKVVLALAPLKYRGIEAATVARAMVELAKEARPGCQIHESLAIRATGEA